MPVAHLDMREVVHLGLLQILVDVQIVSAEDELVGVNEAGVLDGVLEVAGIVFQ